MPPCPTRLVLDPHVLPRAVGEGGAQSWEAFAKHPVRHRPLEARGLFVPRERAEMVPNKEYWDKANRVPKLDRLVLLPLPEANARVAALRSGQVNWIEEPAARRGGQR